MKKVGAIMDNNGKWIINGNPVTVKILIRNDDPLKKTFGDLVASEIEKIGFTVIKDYGDLTKANQIVLWIESCRFELEYLYRILHFKFFFTL